MNKELINLDISLEKMSLHQILIESYEYSDDSSITRVFLGRNSLIKTNQYPVRVYYKLNTTVILNHE